MSTIWCRVPFVSQSALASSGVYSENLTAWFTENRQNSLDNKWPKSHECVELAKNGGQIYGLGWAITVYTALVQYVSNIEMQYPTKHNKIDYRDIDISQ
mgnify:CR=1 FL=1